MNLSHHGLVFGPVRSGRLGASLGLDLLGAKICSFDCLYCEVGRTRALTRVRKPYVTAERMLAELKAWLAAPHPPFEVVTLGGMGEPTLNSHMGRIIEGVRGLCPGAPVAVLTNSSLMDDPQVRRELALADMVLPSMDTLVDSEYQELNRPHPGASVGQIRQGLLDFRREFAGVLALEVLVLDGVNDSQQNLDLLTAFVAKLKPDRVDVTTMSRPGAYPYAVPAKANTLERFRSVLCRTADAQKQPEIAQKAALFASGLDNGDALRLHDLKTLVTASLARRPQTLEQLAVALAAAEDSLEQALGALADEGRVAVSESSGRRFYHLAGDDHTRL